MVEAPGTLWKISGRRGSACLALSALALLGCGPSDTPEEAPFQVRDSAGVEIVENTRPAWGEGEGWSVGAPSLLRLGVVEGDAAQQFTGVTGAVRLGDGTVVVADGGSNEVRFFGPDGNHRGTVGGSGEGPGEFTGLSGLGKDASGRVWAYDFSLRRITWMDAGGQLTGLTSLGLEPAMLHPLGALPGEAFALKQLWGAEQVSGTSETGLRRDPVAFVRFDGGGALMDTVGLFPGREVFLLDEGGRGVMSTPPFARNASGTLREGRVVVGVQERFEVMEWSSEGGLLRLVRILRPERSVGPEDLEGYIQGRLATAPPERHPSIRRSLEDMPVPETMPAYGGLMSDSPGNLWVGEWAMYPQVARRWTVFDSAGAWLGEVEMPPAFSPTDIGEDWILGVETDEMDVEYVSLYPLEKSWSPLRATRPAPSPG